MNAMFFLAALCFAGDAGLARDGASPYVIVVPERPSPVEQTAARELQEHLKQATGATLPITAENTVPADAPKILLGATAALKKLAPDIDLAKLPHDGIVMKTVGKDLILAGRPPRGTLYAVYTFLEDSVGCRWWTSTESFVPKRPVLALPALDLVYAPPLRYREAFYRDAFSGVFAARLKCNGNSNNIAVEYGGHYRFAGFVHTFFPLLPPDKYFAEHPEWYSELHGKRTHKMAQLCLTNDVMRAELTKNAIALLRKTPDAGLISISQNDWHGQCECAKCKAVEKEEGSPSGPLLRFVNAVAESIEPEFPDVLVETLAYQYTRQPPKLVKPRKNVVIRLCSIECSFAQPLAAGPQNEKFRADIEGWSRIAPQLFIWDYVTNFSNYILPHPNLRVLAPNVRYFVDHHTVGLFEQGDYGSTAGDFLALRAWLLSHLMWNPKADEKALIRDFLHGYYGPAAPHLQAYLDLREDAAERSGVYLKCFMPDTAAWLTLDDLNQATRLYDAASRAVARDPVLARRVRRERLTLDHAWLQRYDVLKQKSRAGKLEFLGPADPMAAADEFLRLGRETGAGQCREGQPWSNLEESLGRRFRAPAPPPAECRRLKPENWLDVQDNQFRLSTHGGPWVKLVEDPSASDGMAALMPGNHPQWAIQWPVSNDFAGTWRCLATVRCEAKATTGPAMSVGIYDSRAGKSVVSRRITVEELSEKGKGYVTIDLGEHPLHGGMYFWAAPPNRATDVTAVFVDRFFLIRAKE